MKLSTQVASHVAIALAALFIGFRGRYGSCYEKQIDQIETSCSEIENRTTNKVQAIEKDAEKYVSDVDSTILRMSEESEHRLSDKASAFEKEKARLIRERDQSFIRPDAIAKAYDAGHGELAMDMKALEEGLIRLQVDLNRIKNLHVICKKNQTFSSELQKAKKFVADVDNDFSYVEQKLRDAAGLSRYSEKSLNSPSTP